MKSCKAQIHSKTALTLYSNTWYSDRERTRNDTNTHNRWINIGIQLHQSIDLRHLRAILSTVKSLNYSTLKKKKCSESYKTKTTTKHTHKTTKTTTTTTTTTTKSAEAAVAVFRLLTEEVCFQRRLKWADACGIFNSLRDIVDKCSIKADGCWQMDSVDEWGWHKIILISSQREIKLTLNLVH